MFFKLTYGKEVHIYNPKDNPSLSGLKAYVQTAFKTLPEIFNFSYLDEENDQITISNEEDLKILRLSNIKVVKIFIKEAQFQFFDQTAQVKLDDEVQKLAEQVTSKETQQKEEFVNLVQEIKVPEKQEEVEEKIEEKKDDVPSAIQVAGSQIQNKLKQFPSQMIEQVKEEIVRQSPISDSVKCQEKKQVQPEKPKIIHRVICEECAIRDFEGVRYKCPICENYNICQECEKTSHHPHPFLKIKHPEQANIVIPGKCHDNSHNSLESKGKKMVNDVRNFANGLFKAEKCKQIKEGFQNFAKEILPQQKRNNQFSGLGYRDNFFIADEIRGEHEQNRQPTEEELKQEKIMKNATYIEEILNISYNSCYKFSQKNPTLSQEELLELYFKDTTQLV